MPISVPPYMPIAPRHQPNIDIAGSIGGLGDALIGGLEYGQKRKSDRATRAAFSEPIYNADGSMNFGAMAGKIMQGGGDIDTAMALTRLAETQIQNEYLRGKPNWQRLGPDLVNTNDPAFAGGDQGGLPPAGPELAYPTYPEEPSDVQSEAQTAQAAPAVQPGVIRGRPNPKPDYTVGRTRYSGETNQPIATAPAEPRPLGATDRKAIREAKSNDIQLKATVDALTRAAELNDKIFTGAGAGVRQYLGTKWKDVLVPDQLASPQQAQQTEEWRSIMQPEALQAMANSLTGATTDFELRQFVTLLADPETTPQTRKSQIERMLKLAEEKRLLNADLVQEYEGADVVAEPAAEVSPDNPTSPEPPAEGGQIVEMSDGRYWISDDGVTVMKLD